MQLGSRFRTFCVVVPSAADSFRKSGSGKSFEVFLTNVSSDLNKAEFADKWIEKFLTHLATDRGASTYTQRNYRQALVEFHKWHQDGRKQSPAWEKLQGNDFPAYLRFLGSRSLGPPAIQLPFAPCRPFSKCLIRHG